MRVKISLISRCVLCLSAVIILAGCDGPWSGRSGGGASNSQSINISTASSGTTAYGVLGTSTARIAFIPSGNTVLPVLLESTGTAHISGSRQSIAAAGSVSANAVTPLSISFNVDACAVDSQDLKAICIGYHTPQIAVLDLTQFAQSLSITDITVSEFDTGAGSIVSGYSGGSCIICGAAADIGKHRFVVGGTGGFRVFNYGSSQLAARYDIPVGENFAFLSQPGSDSYIIAPEYDSSLSVSNIPTKKLRVVNLEKATSYEWSVNMADASALGGSLGAASVAAQDIDAAAVDINTKMIALSTESSDVFLLVDFGQAIFNEVDKTFTASFQIVNRTYSESGLGRLTDVAMSTTGNLLLSHGEFSSYIGLTQMPASAGVSGVFPAGVGSLGEVELNDANLNRAPCSSSGTGAFSFSGKGDPHGLGLYAGLDNGQKGLIVNSDNTCIAIIDLAKLKDAPRTSSNGNLFDTSAPGVSGLFSFMKL